MQMRLRPTLMESSLFVCRSSTFQQARESGDRRASEGGCTVGKPAIGGARRMVSNSPNACPGTSLLRLRLYTNCLSSPLCSALSWSSPLQRGTTAPRRSATTTLPALVPLRDLSRGRDELDRRRGVPSQCLGRGFANHP